MSRLCRRPKLPQALIDLLTDEEIQKIKGEISPKTVIGERIQAIFLLMLDTGICASELRTLKLEQSSIAEGSRKDNKERIVHFANGTKKVLLLYLTTVRPETDHLIKECATVPALFTGLSANDKWNCPPSLIVT